MTLLPYQQRPHPGRPRHLRRLPLRAMPPLRWVWLIVSETRRRVVLPFLGWRAIRWMHRHPEARDEIIRAVYEHMRAAEEGDTQ